MMVVRVSEERERGEVTAVFVCVRVCVWVGAGGC